MSEPGGSSRTEGQTEPELIDVGSPIESSAAWQVRPPSTREEAGLALPGRVVAADRIAVAPGWLITSFVGAACVVLGLSVVWRGDPSETVAGFWPPAGVGLVALLLVPRPRWGWVFAGILVPTVVGLVVGAMAVRAGLIWAMGNCLGPAVGASLLAWLSVADTPLRGRPLLTYLFSGALLGPVVGGAVGSLGTVLDYGEPWATVWLEWVLADGLGVLVITPLLLVRQERPPPNRRPQEVVGLVVLVLAAAALAFVPVGEQLAAVVPYLMLVALIWAGMRFGTRTAAAAAFVVALAANVATSLGVGPFSGEGEGPEALAVQVFLAIAIVTSIVVASMAAQLADRDEVNRLLTHQATHDALTGLPNRALFAERVAAALAAGTGLGVLLLDIDGFSRLNQQHGRPAADALLRSAAERLGGRLGPGDLLARVGGDEFAVVAPGVGDEAAAAMAERLLGALQEVSADGRRHRLRARVGVATVGAGDPIRASDLVRRADLALVEARRVEAPAVARFDEALEASRRRATGLGEELRGAVARGEIWVAYQPVVDLATGAITGFEALARWTNRRYGAVGPDEFIPIAEDSGLVGELGGEVLGRACRDLAGWRADPALDAADLHLAVNVSARQLTEPTLEARVVDEVAAAGVPADALTLEITETAVMRDVELVSSVIAGLRRHGIRIAMDDFGTGHSSMRNLRRIPLDILKVDASFVAGLGRSPEDTAIVESVVRLGHSFGLVVVAEGVETDDQRVHLQRLGCDEGQGYLWGRPVPAAAVGGLLGQWAVEAPRTGPG